jgi:type II secretory pathway pseudopilin PulG
MKLLSKEEGFSLVEVLAIIAIVGVISAIALPSFISGMPKRRLKAAARDLYGAMQQARLLGVKNSLTCRVMIEADSYYLDQDNDGEFDGIDESFTDEDGNGVYDFGEPYTDSDGGGSYSYAEKRLDLSEYGDVEFGNGTAPATSLIDMGVAANGDFPVAGTPEPCFLFSAKGEVSYAQNCSDDNAPASTNMFDTVYLQNISNPLESVAITANIAGGIKISWYDGQTWR